MKINEVPQDDVPDYSQGIKKGNYALDDQGKYVMVPSKGWVIDEQINKMAYDEYQDKVEETRKAVLAGQKSPLAYYMELRQMIPKFLGKTAGIATFRVKRHLRPEIFSKLNDSVLDKYAKALAITREDLKIVPQNSYER
ncbi:MAG: hypothetical protein APR62_12375 [Smithella sp. SDB]|nr:MAG: hypothetical protein APR62_12375 [Smithella sp. SDB]